MWAAFQLNLKNAAAVERAWRAIESSVSKRAGKEHFQGVTVQPMIKLDGYEIIIGSSVDSQFGPVLLFGSGGQLVEVYKDRALALPPLNATLARRMMEQTKIYTALKGVRGRPPVNLAALEELLVRFSYLVVGSLDSEIDFNPLLASPETHHPLDARSCLRKDVKRTNCQAATGPIRSICLPWKLKNGNSRSPSVTSAVDSRSWSSSIRRFEQSSITATSASSSWTSASPTSASSACASTFRREIALGRA
jgi:acetyltransferase